MRATVHYLGRRAAGTTREATVTSRTARAAGATATATAVAGGDTAALVVVGSLLLRNIQSVIAPGNNNVKGFGGSVGY